MKIEVGQKFYQLGKNFGEHVPLTTKCLGAGLRNSEVHLIEIIDIYVEDDIAQIKHTVDGTKQEVLTLTQFKNIYGADMVQIYQKEINKRN